MAQFRIRPAAVSDTAAIEHVCLATGLAGEDGTGAFGDDRAVGEVYATPYLHAPERFGWVVQGDDAVVGYLLGTRDTRAFQQWFGEQWWTGQRARRTAQTTDDAWLLSAATDPSRMINDFVDDYPAHLHIDLLPRAQGRGLGRHLIETLMVDLRERQVPGVHLEAALANAGAQAFYPRVGFAELRRHEHGVIWGRTV